MERVWMQEFCFWKPNVCGSRRRMHMDKAMWKGVYMTCRASRWKLCGVSDGRGQTVSNDAQQLQQLTKSPSTLSIAITVLVKRVSVWAILLAVTLWKATRVACETHASIFTYVECHAEFRFQKQQHLHGIACLALANRLRIRTYHIFLIYSLDNSTVYCCYLLLLLLLL